MRNKDNVSPKLLPKIRSGETWEAVALQKQGDCLPGFLRPSFRKKFQEDIVFVSPSPRGERFLKGPCLQ